MHYFSYDIASVSTSASSPETWKERNDSVLVLCLTREDHELTVSGGQFLLKYDEGEDTFHVESQPSEGGDAAGGSGEGGSGGVSGGLGRAGFRADLRKAEVEFKANLIRINVYRR